MSASSVKPLDLFPYKELDPLPTSREPNYNDLNYLQKQLNANAMSVEAMGGSGQHGFLVLVVDANTHMHITGHNFPKPKRPDMVPPIEAHDDSNVISLKVEIHKMEKVEWNNYNNTLKELRTQLLAAVPRDLIEELADEDSDFNNVPPLRIMQYLNELYGKITPDMLKDNLDKLATPWNPTDPINTLWKQVKDCVAFAKKGNEPILESTAVRIVVKILEDTQVFPLDMHNWQQRSDADQASFLELKKHFIRANIVHCCPCLFYIIMVNFQA
jgi:hypothetical protein